MIISNKPYTKDSKGFYIMPNELHYQLYEMGLTAQEKLIYECLIRYSNNSENNPFPSYSTLQKFASCGRATVSKALRSLQEKGLVEVLSKGNNITKQSNVYKINYVYDSPKATKIDSEGLKNSKRINTASKKETVNIPFNRGTHPDIMTSKDSEEIQRMTAQYVDYDYSDFDRILA